MFLQNKCKIKKSLKLQIEQIKLNTDEAIWLTKTTIRSGLNVYEFRNNLFLS